MNIFEISKDYLELISTIEELEGELTPELALQLEITEQDAKAKLESYQRVILLRKGTNSVIETEIARLQSMISKNVKLIERLQKVQLDAVKLFGDKNKKGVISLQTELYRFSTRKSTSVEVDDMKCNLTNTTLQPYFKIKIPMELSYLQYLKVKGLIKEVDELKDLKVEDIININVDKKAVKSALELEANIAPELFDNQQTIKLDGVKLVTNTNINVR